ncbi:hypothetical protein ACOMHN_026175 [Nucella lapillus]
MQLLWKITPIYVILLTSLMMTSEVTGRDVPPPKIAKNEETANGGNSLLTRLLRESGEGQREKREKEGEGEGDVIKREEETTTVGETTTKGDNDNDNDNDDNDNNNNNNNNNGCSKESYCEMRKRYGQCDKDSYAKKYCEKTCGGNEDKDDTLCDHWKKRDWCTSTHGNSKEYINKYCCVC